MKKITISVLAILLLSVAAKSQITKGNWMLGGNISYASTQYKSENYGPEHIVYDFTIKPSVGYFFGDKFVGGIKAAIIKRGTKDPGTPGNNKNTDFNLGFFSRYYFLPEEKQVNILFESSYLYGFVGGGSGQNTSTSKNTFALAAGPVIYFNTSVGLEFLIGYSTYKFSGINGSNGTIQIGIGLQIHLEKDKNGS